MSDKQKADAIKEFVNLMIGAHESGFIDKNNPTISEIHQCAKNHIKDNYGIETPNIVEEFGVPVAVSCGMPAKTADRINNLNSKSKQ